MFHQSQLQAIKDYYEQEALKTMMPPTNSNNTKGPHHYVVPLVGEDTEDLLQRVNSTKVMSVIDKSSDAELKSNHSSSGHQHSDPRQSSFFSSFRPPTLTNPLGVINPMANLLKPPSLPTLPTFQLPQPAYSPPAPPRRAIIGNGGGPMALTNDNVVVVNVLSSNW